MTAEDKKLLGALGLARRAGRLVTGLAAVCEAAEKGRAALALVTSDTAPNTKKKLLAACGACPLAEIGLSQYDIATLTGKPAGALAVTDKDLAMLCLAKAGRAYEEEPD